LVGSRWLCIIFMFLFLFIFVFIFIFYYYSKIVFRWWNIIRVFIGMSNSNFFANEFNLNFSINSFKSLMRLKNTQHLKNFNFEWGFIIFKLKVKVIFILIVLDILIDFSGNVLKFFHKFNLFYFEFLAFFFNIFIIKFSKKRMTCFHFHFLFWCSIPMSINCNNTS
jgi:hypothetical protein